MRILHVGVGNLGPGGVATYLRNTASAQSARGHDVLVCEIWPGPSSMPEVDEFVGSLPELSRLQERWEPDIVHLHSQLPRYEDIRAAAVLTAHDHSAHCPSGGRYLEASRTECRRSFGLVPCLWGHYVDHCGSRSPRSFLKRYGVTAATPSFRGHWIAPSRYTGTWLRRRSIPADRIHVVGNPQMQDLGETARRPDPEPVALFLGRLVPNKGCDVLIRAFAGLPRTARLHVVGDGPELSSLQTLASSLGLSNRVRFFGWQEPGRVQEHLLSASVLAVPSLWPEPFGLVALEAYAASRPVVASAIGGLQDLVIDGRTGALVPPGDAHALCDALRPFLESQDAVIESGSRGRLWSLETHPLGGHLDNLEHVYNLASGRSP